MPEPEVDDGKCFGRDIDVLAQSAYHADRKSCACRGGQKAQHPGKQSECGLRADSGELRRDPLAEFEGSDLCFDDEHGGEGCERGGETAEGEGGPGGVKVLKR